MSRTSPHIPEIEEVYKIEEKLRKRSVDITEICFPAASKDEKKRAVRKIIRAANIFAQQKIDQIFNEEEHRNEGTILARTDIGVHREDGVGIHIARSEPCPVHGDKACTCAWGSRSPC